jgi:P4 family phage/plasmid primase-like protien
MPKDTTDAHSAQYGAQPLLNHALSYHSCGYWVIPLAPRDKRTFEEDWPELRLDRDGIGQRWARCADHNIGLLTGTELNDGAGYLAAIDIDVDEDDLIERVRRALPGDAPAKRGAKGLTLFVRTDRPITKADHKRKGESRAAVEVLGLGQQTCVPPSIHPDTAAPYQWLGRPLIEWQHDQLPLADAHVLREVELAVKDSKAKLFLLNDMTPSAGKEPGSMHNSCLRAVGYMVKKGFPKTHVVARCLRATREADKNAGGKQRDYGKHQRALEKMYDDAIAKGFDKTEAKETPHRMRAHWMLDQWRGGDMIRVRGGQVFIYDDGWHRPHDDGQLLRLIAHCNDGPGMNAIDISGWRPLIATLVPLAPELPHPPSGRSRVCLANGTFDLNTGELLPHAKDDWLINHVDFAYDPDATCPVYDAFIQNTFATDDPEEQRRAVDCYEEFVALTMIENHDYQKFLVVEGMPGTGKSKLLFVARRMHADGSVASVMVHDLNNERSRSTLVGKLLNISGEAEIATNIADSYLKMITGGDPVATRMLYQEVDSNVVLPTRFIIATNEPLKTRDTSGAVLRRMLILKCDNKVPPDKKDLKLEAKLEAERPGIFLRIARAWRRLRDRGNFDPPGSSLDLAKQFAISNNLPVQHVLERTYQGAQVDLPQGTADYTLSDLLYIDFVEWSKRNGYKQMSNSTWGTKLKDGKEQGLLPPGVDPESYGQWISGGPKGRNLKCRRLTLLSPAKY